MSLVGKNRALFRYKNDDRSGSTFQYKDFEKTKSYNSKFVHAKFIGTSLRAAHMKYCNFDNCLFDQVDFVGANMRGSSFIGARCKNRRRWTSPVPAGGSFSSSTAVWARGSSGDSFSAMNWRLT